jgi:hypothetical protein
MSQPRSTSQLVWPALAVLFTAALGLPSAYGQTIQGGFRIDVLGTVSPSSPSVTIHVSASWQPHPAYLWFDNGRFDFASDTSGAFSDPEVLPVYTRRIVPQGSRPGVVSGNLVEGVLLDQTFQPHLSLIPLSDNPLPLWEVTWTTQDFTPRFVPIGTAGIQWMTVLHSGGPFLQYNPSSVLIRVVPAPTIIGPVLAGMAFGARRRR